VNQIIIHIVFTVHCVSCYSNLTMELIKFRSTPMVIWIMLLKFLRLINLRNLITVS